MFKFFVNFERIHKLFWLLCYFGYDILVGRSIKVNMNVIWIMFVVYCKISTKAFSVHPQFIITFLNYCQSGFKKQLDLSLLSVKDFNGSLETNVINPVDTRPKLNAHDTFIRRPGHHINVSLTLHLSKIRKRKN